MLNFFKKFLSRYETFEAFSYVYKDGTIANPGQMTTYVKWLKDITIFGLSSEEREKLAFQKFREENNLKEGKVWIFGNYVWKPGKYKKKKDKKREDKLFFM